jgi:hypothetical protein
MWLISFLPTAFLAVIVNSVLLLGIAVFLLSFFITTKLLPLQKTIVQVVSVCLIVLGVYWKGGLAIEEQWRERVKSAEDAARLAEEKFKQTNLELGKAIAQRDHAVATRGKTIVEKTLKYLQGDPVTHTSTVNLSPEERAELEKQIAELQRAEKECPVPKLVVKAINDAVVPVESKK